MVPVPASSVVARWLSSPRIGPNLVAVRELPPRPARWLDIPQDLEPRLVSALWDRGVTRLYSHQADALDTTALYGMEWTVMQGSVFDLWLDDLWFYE